MYRHGAKLTKKPTPLKGWARLNYVTENQRRFRQDDGILLQNSLKL